MWLHESKSPLLEVSILCNAATIIVSSEKLSVATKLEQLSIMIKLLNNSKIYFYPSGGGEEFPIFNG